MQRTFTCAALDDEGWTIRYMEVATRNWLPGKKFLVSPAWIRKVSWAESKVFVRLTREAIRSGPEYVESNSVTREYEDRLYAHYGQPPCWQHETENQSSLTLTGV